MDKQEPWGKARVQKVQDIYNKNGVSLNQVREK